MRRLAPLAFVAAAACGGSSSTPSSAPVAPSGPGPAAVPVAPAAPAPARRPPVAERRIVTDTYHGVTVEDPYRWLEADDAPEVDAWSDGQNRYARAILDQLPGLEVLRAELRAIIAAPEVRFTRLAPAGGRVFALRKRPEREQQELVVMDRPEDAARARLVLDPTADGDRTRSIDWFVPSPDGRAVAVSISVGGSESGTVHVLDLDGQPLDAPIPDVQYGGGGGDLAWRPDGKGFWYTRYPAAGERPEEERRFWSQVWWHELGTPRSADRYELGKDLPRIAMYRLEADARGQVVASVQQGDGGIYRHYLRDRKGRWSLVADWKDQVAAVDLGPDGALWLISRKGAPRGQVLRLGPGQPLARAKVVIPEGEAAIETDYYDDVGLTFAGDRVYALYQVGGPSELRAFTRAGKPAPAPALPPVSTVNEPVVLDDGALLVQAGSYTTPWTYYRHDAATGALTALPGLRPPPPVDLSGFEVRRETAISKDGTRVPYSVVWPAGAAQDGTRPCVVSGYGGFAISTSPSYLATWAPVLRRGVCFVEANLRGGAEYGEAWHQDGMLTRKQHVFDDFAAVLDDVAGKRYSAPAHIVTMGGSNGGLLMGAALTQYPDKMKAVVSAVGIYDMLRNELTTNGSYNVPEYGTVQDEAQFRALYAYSPYHHVRAGTRYPAVLLYTGKNDARVAPWHSRKLAAALQAAQAGDAPILLRTSDDSGHGAGTAMSEQIEVTAHRSAFILWQLGLGDRIQE